MQFEGFDFWDQYSIAVKSLLDSEESVIKNNPNYSKDEVEYHLKEHERAVVSFEAMIDLNKHNEPILHSPFNFLSRLMDVDELFTTWRQRHALMVRRMIGSKIGTGGSSGHAYLKSTADRHKVFAELADLSTFFIPRSALPELPEHIKRNLGYYFQS